MNRNIIGDKATIDYAKKLPPGSTQCYIDWDAIDDLPEEYEAVISRVEFDHKNDFSPVGGDNFMPNPNIIYKIAEACGISGYRDSNTAPVYQEVNVNEMDRAPGYHMIKFHVGYESIKTSKVLTEDGSFRDSSPCTAQYNAWDRAVALWSKEEKFTNGYSKKGKYPNKYETKYDRKAHFSDLMKFALKIAETQAFGKTVRELAGLKTGYKIGEISGNVMFFSRIRKSKKLMKLETAARLTNIENGGHKQAPGSNLLFENNNTQQIEDNSTEDIIQADHEIVNEVSNEQIETVDSLRDKLSIIGEKCTDFETLVKMVEWLEGDIDISKPKPLAGFNKALEFFKEHQFDDARPDSMVINDDDVPF